MLPAKRLASTGTHRPTLQLSSLRRYYLARIQKRRRIGWISVSFAQEEPIWAMQSAASANRRVRVAIVISPHVHHFIEIYFLFPRRRPLRNRSIFTQRANSLNFAQYVRSFAACARLRICILRFLTNRSKDNTNRDQRRCDFGRPPFSPPGRPVFWVIRSRRLLGEILSARVAIESRHPP